MKEEDAYDEAVSSKDSQQKQKAHDEDGRLGWRLRPRQKAQLKLATRIKGSHGAQIKGSQGRQNCKKDLSAHVLG